jgi:hypothetical protein
MKYKSILVIGVFLLLFAGLVFALGEKKETMVKGDLKPTLYKEGLAEKKVGCGGWDKTSKLDYKNKFHSGQNIVYAKLGWVIVKLFSIALIAFMVSSIFWLTHNWLVKGKK